MDERAGSHDDKEMDQEEGSNDDCYQANSTLMDCKSCPMKTSNIYGPPVEELEVQNSNFLEEIIAKIHGLVLEENVHPKDIAVLGDLSHEHLSFMWHIFT